MSQKKLLSLYVLWLERDENMPKEITRREALSVIKARLYQVFDDNIKSLKIIKDKIKRDYDNF